MPIFSINNKRILFIHIPKTGGTSIETWLESLGVMNFYAPLTPDGFRSSPQHFRMADFNLLFGEDYQWDYAFTIVRNPYEKLRSEYFYRATNQKRHSYSEWIRRLLTQYIKNNFVLDNHLRPQNHFIESNLDVFKFEDGMDNIIAEIAPKIGVDKPAVVPKENVSVKQETKLSNETLNLINRIYKNDFDQLGYTMLKPKININNL